MDKLACFPLGVKHVGLHTNYCFKPSLGIVGDLFEGLL